MIRNLFIAYTRTDNAPSIVERLWKDLTQVGFSVWLDVEQKLDTDDWKTQAYDTIRACDAFVLVLPLHVTAMSICQQELQLARELHKPIVAVSFEPITAIDVPPDLPDTVIQLSHHLEHPITNLDKLVDRLNLLRSEPTTGSVEMTDSFDRIRRALLAEVDKQKARSKPLSPNSRSKLLGKFIRQSLVDVGLTEQAFIDKLGLDAEYVVGILNGEFLPHRIDDDVLVTIARAIDFDANTLRALLGRPVDLSTIPDDDDLDSIENETPASAPPLAPAVNQLATMPPTIALQPKRVHLICEIASRIGSTLDYNRILDAALDIGKVALKDTDLAGSLMSMVLIRQHNQLMVMASSYLASQDEQLTIPGKQGIFSQALRQITPLFTKYRDDPELRYFISFRQIQSLLIVPLRDGYDSYGLIVAGSMQPRAFSEQYAELVMVLGNHVALALRNAELYHQLRATDNFSTIAARINLARRQLRSKPQDADLALQEVEKLAQQTTQEIQRLLLAHKPFAIESQGLGGLLRDLALRMQETQGFIVDIDIQSDIEYQLDDKQKGALFYIVEEVVAYARKYAHATHVTINLFTRQDYAILSIQDNGIGFDTESINSIYNKHGDSGLYNLRQRVELINGLLHIWNIDRRSKTGKGTKISVLVPIEAPSLRKALTTLTSKLNKEHQHPNDEQSINDVLRF